MIRPEDFTTILQHLHAFHGMKTQFVPLLSIIFNAQPISLRGLKKMWIEDDLAECLEDLRVQGLIEGGGTTGYRVTQKGSHACLNLYRLTGQITKEAATCQ